MPIEEVVAKYGRSEDEVDSNGDVPKEKDGESSAPKKLLTHPAVAELTKKGRKPISPFLRAKPVSRLGSDGTAESENGEESESNSEEKNATDSVSADKSEEASGEVKTEEEKDSKSESKTENGGEKKSTNGHSDADAKVDDDDAKPVTQNGETEKCVSVKGKGKGKGKSSMSKIAAPDNSGEKKVSAAEVLPKKKKAKSADELYKHVLVADSDCDDEDLDDEEDETFGEGEEEEGEDSDEYEDMVSFLWSCFLT